MTSADTVFSELCYAASYNECLETWLASQIHRLVQKTSGGSTICHRGPGEPADRGARA